MNVSAAKKPVLLCILDGWGERPAAPDNAIAHAATPFYDALLATYPHSSLETSGAAVGLPDGQMGNSEVGHMNIGAGRIVMQNLPRIDAAFKNGGAARLPALVAAIDALRASGGRLHLFGMASRGGVHSHRDHIIALVKIFADAGVSTSLHIVTDGRDVPPKSALDELEGFLEELLPYGDAVSVDSVCGRYYAMDRDNRHERTEAAYNAVVAAQSKTRFDDPLDYVRDCYAQGTYDEFIPPAARRGAPGAKNGDAFLSANFRSDRMRQTFDAVSAGQYKGFVRKHAPKWACLISMTEYDAAFNDRAHVLFPPQNYANLLSEVISGAGKTQLHVAETEKYAHVTFFFNGGREDPFPGEDRVMAPSPNVATYDLKPEMSAFDVTEKLIERMGAYDFIVVNYANADMVGHTGNFAAAVKAAEAVDACLARIVPKALALGGAVVVTADHGNAEQMTDGKGGAHTAHTVLPVPFVLASAEKFDLADGRLCDVAPTVLQLMGLPVPAEMTGRSLIQGGAGR
ncbi:MAG: 2,3-bisphosphoglycerate-independent phosphoglycerate mutase [Rickettsiales bacterium]